MKQRFDFVYATIGVLSWIEDVDAWMHAAASALRAGGRLALVDIHPLYQMIAATDPLDLDFPYAFDGPRRFNDPGSYADRDAVVHDTATIQYGHSLGEIVTAAIAFVLANRLLRVFGNRELDAQVENLLPLPGTPGRG